MGMNIGTVNSASALAKGSGAIQGAKINGEKSKFDSLVKEMQASSRNGSLSSVEVSSDGRLDGEYTSGFGGTFLNEADRHSLPRGAAANQANAHSPERKIDRTSKLYEKSLELESYFVKQMLGAMRKTVSKSALGSNDFAGEMYEDMLFEEYAVNMTKNAGFGLADQIYLSLA